MTTTHEFTIRTLNVIDGKENTAGNRWLANFVLETSGVIVTGCTMILRADGEIVVW